MTYHRPLQLNQALELAAMGARVLAGGTDILPALQGRDLTGTVLDLTAVTGLRGITESAKRYRIGATTRWSDVIAADLPAAFDALKQAAHEVGSVQIQNSGTVAGNIANASPAADGVPALLVLDADVELSGANSKRLIPLAEFITGVRRTALLPGEIVTALEISKSATSGVSAFQKLGARKYLVISIAMVAVRLVLHNGRIEQAAVAVGACSPVARRLTGFEAALRGLNVAQPSAWRAALQADITARLDPIDDIRANVGYRINAVAELIDQAIAAAAQEGE
jgi:CO/xanthine dehydrogenase FAD-binding subunit